MRKSLESKLDQLSKGKVSPVERLALQLLLADIEVAAERF